MRLQLSTWPEVERYLDTSKGVIIPVGSTEQHGPTGFIGTKPAGKARVVGPKPAVFGTKSWCPPIIPFGLARKGPT